MKLDKLNSVRNGRKQKGYTLLEYSAGAAILLGILYVGVQALATGNADLLQDIGQRNKNSVDAYENAKPTAVPARTLN